MSAPRIPAPTGCARVPARKGDDTMKLCRYDDDRLGVVIGDKVHDVTQAQTEIRNSTPYTAKVDPVVAALPQWRDKLEQMAKSAPGKPIAQVKLLSPVAQAAEDPGGADQLRQARRGDAEVPRHHSGPGAVLAGHREGRHLPEVQHLAGRSVGGHPDALSRPPQRSRGRARASSSASRAATSRRRRPATTSPAIRSAST